MRAVRVDVSLDADWVMPLGEQPMTFSTSRQDIVIQNAELAASGLHEGLTAKIILPDVELYQAIDLACAELSPLLDYLSFFTSVAFKVGKICRAIEWNSNQAHRKFIFEYSEPAGWPPSANLTAGYAGGPAGLLNRDLDKYLQRALRTYRKAVISDDLEDHFVHFWKVCEILAALHPPSSAPSKCPFCKKTELFCVACGEQAHINTKVHEGIKFAMKKMKVPDVDGMFKRLLICRNKISHGSTVKSIEKACGESLVNMGATMQKIAWHHLKQLIPGKWFATDFSAIRPGLEPMPVTRVTQAWGTFFHRGASEHPNDAAIPQFVGAEHSAGSVEVH